MQDRRSIARKLMVTAVAAAMALALAAPGAQGAAHKYTVSYSGSTNVSVKVVDTLDVQHCNGQEVDTSAGSESAKFKTVHVHPVALSGGNANPDVALSSAKANFSLTRAGSLTPQPFEDASECQLPPNYSTTCLPRRTATPSFALRPSRGKETIYNDSIPDFFFDPKATGAAKPCTTEQLGGVLLTTPFQTRVKVSKVRALAVGGKVTDSRTVQTPRGHSGDNSRSSTITTTVRYTLTIKRVS